MSRQTDRRTDEKDDPFPLFSMYPPPFSQTLSKTAAAAWFVSPYFSTVRLLILSLRPGSVGASDFCAVWKKKREEEETANYSSVSSLSSSPLPLFEMFLFCASCLVGKLGKRPVVSRGGGGEKDDH